MASLKRALDSCFQFLYRVFFFVSDDELGFRRYCYFLRSNRMHDVALSLHQLRFSLNNSYLSI